MTEEIKLRSNRKNLTGQKFGKLTVIKPVKTINDTSRWLCKCECGNKKVVATYRLLSGRVKTCGDCFNTINFYIPEIKRLEQENKDFEILAKSLYKRIEELEKENEALAFRERLYKADYKASEQENIYRSALEEIKEKIKSLNKDICNNCGWHNTDNCQPNGYVCHDLIEIKNKIDEVLPEGKINE